MFPVKSYSLCILFLFGMLKMQGQQPELLLPVGHTENVVYAHFSPDGKIVATASHDNTVKIWDARNGRLLYTLEGIQNWNSTIDFSPNSKTIIVANDSALQIRELHTGRLLHTLNEHIAKITVAHYSPDGKRIITAAEDHDVFIWDAHSGKRVSRLKGYTPFVNNSRYSPDGKTIVTTANRNDSIVKVWNAESGNLLFELNGHSKSYVVNIACYSPDSKYLVSASSDHTAIIWDLQTGSLLHRLWHYEDVINVNYSPDGKKIVTASEDKTAKIWDANTGLLLYTLEGHADKVHTAVFSPDGKTILTSSTDKTAKKWDAENGNLLYTIGDKNIVVNNAGFSPDGKYILTAEPGTAKLWDTRNARQLTILQGHTEMATSAAYSTDGKIMVTSSTDNTAKIWDMRTGRMIHVLKGHNSTVNTVGFSPDGKYIITTSYDSTARIWDAQKGTLLYTLKGHTDVVNMALYSPNGKTIVTASNDNVPKLWDAQTGKLLCSVEGNHGLVSQGCFSRDGKTIVTMALDIAAKLWDVQTGKLLQTFKDEEEEYNLSVARFSPDDKKVLTAYRNGVIRIWDTKSGNLLKQLTGDEEAITNISFTADGKRIISACESKVKIFDALTGDLLLTLPAIADGDITPLLGPDNKKIATSAYSDTAIKIWDLASGKLIKTIPYKGTLFNISWKHKKIITHENSRVFVSDFETGKELFSSIAIDVNGFLTKTKDNYYQASPAAAQWLFWRKDNRLYDFDQWDLQYNRPDKVLQTLGSKDTALIGAYKKAYQKRMRKMQVDTSMFRSDYHLPETEILNLKEAEELLQTSTVNLKIRCYETDKSNSIRKLFVTVNGNPVYGANGMDVKSNNITDTTFNITVSLNSGGNVVKVSCLNNRGAESLRQSAYINYEPALAVNPKTYYIGIGVSHYKDSNNNLQYADKDVKDLAAAFQKKYPAAIITLLTNENATREQIRAIKKQLLLTHPDDKVIISFSGHGVIDKNYDFYFATHDIDFKNPSARGLSYDEIEWLLDSVPSGNKLVLMDACHSGELDKEGNYSVDINTHPSDNNVKEVRGFKVTSKDSTGLGLKNAFEIMQGLFANIGRGNGATVISAAAGTEFAYEGNNWANGVFTYCTMQGLTENKADTNKDGTVTVTELQDYVSEQVETLTRGRQKPTSRQTNYDNNWRIW